MILTGQAITNIGTSGQNVDLKISWTYPASNPLFFGLELQPTTPPVELGSVEFRLTSDRTALVNVDDTSINWIRHIKGTNDQPTADYINGVWVGKDDYTVIKGLPVKPVWYYQARCWSRAGIPSDWTDIFQIVDAPPVLPTPEITSVNTNQKDQVRLIWSDVASQISNFSHYELAKEETDVTRRLDVNAVIVGG